MHDSTDRRRERDGGLFFSFSLSLPRGLFDIAGCSDVRVLRRHGNCLTMTPPGGARDGQKKNKSLLSIVYTSQRPYPPTTSDRERSAMLISLAHGRPFGPILPYIRRRRTVIFMDFHLRNAYPRTADY